MEYNLVTQVLKRNFQGFPGGLVVKTLPSSVGGAGLIPGQGAKTPHASWPKKKKKPNKPQNRINIVTNSIKTKKHGSHF